MAKNLVIVESPAKARTIGRYLGRAYTVKPSLGHVRDLPSGRLGVNVEDNFEPKYVVSKDKKDLVKELNKLLEDATTLFLATDPDREGEAIAWHLSQALKVGDRTVKRVVFHEITEPAIKEAFTHSRDINLHLVNAQQARRILDRLVGYKLSPLLWKKIRGGLSAGRVQSAALHILVDREREIEAFVPQEYWKLVADLEKTHINGKRQVYKFPATLTGTKGAKKKLEITNQAQATQIVRDLEGAVYTVVSVTKKETQRKPTAPFTTSTLQQEAWRKLRFSASRTMALAQQLYEGLPVGTEGTLGLITYMRTDSPVVSAGAIQETRTFVRAKYGKEYLPKEARLYTARSKGAQEAHEAIRPTGVGRTPAEMKQYLEPAQFRLYELIWKRLVASQMANAIFDATAVDIGAARRGAGAKSYIFHATGSVQKFAGFLLLYVEGKDTTDDDDAGILPPLEKDETLTLLGLDPQQKFTQPPPRFTEATLVKALEEAGIGRPSTYAPIMSTITERGYVKKEAGTLKPQQLGMLVNDLLQESFPNIIDAQFTAHMEEELDEIARGEKAWVPVLEEFYSPFDKALVTATENLPKMPETTDEVCDVCGKPMVIKSGRFGLFLACSGYPECFRTNAEGKNVANTKPLLVKMGVKCPLDAGELVEKRARKGNVFYSCANYPNCTFAMNLKPIPEPCPNCGGLLGAFPRGGVKCTKCEYKGRRPRSGAQADGQEQGQEQEQPLVAVGA